MGAVVLPMALVYALQSISDQDEQRREAKSLGGQCQEDQVAELTLWSRDVLRALARRRATSWLNPSALCTSVPRCPCMQRALIVTCFLQKHLFLYVMRLTLRGRTPAAACQESLSSLLS